MRGSIHGSDDGPPQFYFRKRQGRIDWRAVTAVDVDRVMCEVNYSVLQANLEHLTFADIESEDTRYLDPNFVKLFKLAQLTIEYLLQGQEFLVTRRQNLERSLDNALDDLRRVQEERDAVAEELRASKKELRQQRKIISTYELMTKGTMSVGPAAEYHKCAWCSKVFTSLGFLESHVTRRHPEHMEAFRQGAGVGGPVTTNGFHGSDGDASHKLAVLQEELEAGKRRLSDAERDMDRRLEDTRERLRQQMELDQERERTEMRRQLERVEEEFRSRLDAQRRELEEREIARIAEYRRQMDAPQPRGSLGRMVDEDEDAHAHPPLPAGPGVSQEEMERHLQARMQAQLEDMFRARAGALSERLEEQRLEQERTVSALAEENRRLQDRLDRSERERAAAERRGAHVPAPAPAPSPASTAPPAAKERAPVVSPPVPSRSRDPRDSGGRASASGAPPRPAQETNGRPPRGGSQRSSQYDVSEPDSREEEQVNSGASSGGLHHPDTVVHLILSAKDDDVPPRSHHSKKDRSPDKSRSRSKSRKGEGRAIKPESERGRHSSGRRSSGKDRSKGSTKSKSRRSHGSRKSQKSLKDPVEIAAALHQDGYKTQDVQVGTRMRRLVLPERESDFLSPSLYRVTPPPSADRENGSTNSRPARGATGARPALSRAPALAPAPVLSQSASRASRSDASPTSLPEREIPILPHRPYVLARWSQTPEDALNERALVDQEVGKELAAYGIEDRAGLSVLEYDEKMRLLNAKREGIRGDAYARTHQDIESEVQRLAEAYLDAGTPRRHTPQAPAPPPPPQRREEQDDTVEAFDCSSADGDRPAATPAVPARESSQRSLPRSGGSARDVLSPGDSFHSNRSDALANSFDAPSHGPMSQRRHASDHDVTPLSPSPSPVVSRPGTKGGPNLLGPKKEASFTHPKAEASFDLSPTPKKGGRKDVDVVLDDLDDDFDVNRVGASYATRAPPPAAAPKSHVYGAGLVNKNPHAAAMAELSDTDIVL